MSPIDESHVSVRVTVGLRSSVSKRHDSCVSYVRDMTHVCHYKSSTRHSWLAQQQHKQSHPVLPLSRAAQAASSVFPSAPFSLLSRRAVRCDWAVVVLKF